MSDNDKIKKLEQHKSNLEYEVELLKRKESNERSRVKLLQEKIEKEKLRIEALKEQIEKEKGSPPKVYDPKSRVDAGRWNDSSYGIPDLIKGSGYKDRLHDVWRPHPLVSVWKCDHPAAMKWCRNTLTEEISALEEEVKKTKRKRAKYIE